MEYRAFVTIKSGWPLPPEMWDRLCDRIEQNCGEYGPAYSYWPDRPGDSFEVVMSVEAGDAPNAAGRLLMALADQVKLEELGMVHVASFCVEEVHEQEAVAV